MGKLFEKNDIPKYPVTESEIQSYAEGNFSQFENVEIKKVSELSSWNKVGDFLGSKKMGGISTQEIVLANGGKEWDIVFGSNDSKSSYRPMTIILKKEIFDDENISDEDASWLIHEIGHIKFYQGLGDELNEYMKEYHGSGKYADSAMEESAFTLQFEYLKSIGKTRLECEEIIKKYLDTSFGEDERIEEDKKKSKSSEYNQIIKFLNNVFKAETDEQAVSD